MSLTCKTSRGKEDSSKRDLKQIQLATTQTSAAINPRASPGSAHALWRSPAYWLSVLRSVQPLVPLRSPCSLTRPALRARPLRPRPPPPLPAPAAC